MRYFALIMVGIIGALALSGCAAAPPQGPSVAVFAGGKTKMVPAGDIDEADYRKRGYIKNSDGKGNTMYVLIPKTDVVEPKPDRGGKREDRLRTGNGGKGKGGRR